MQVWQPIKALTKRLTHQLVLQHRQCRSRQGRPPSTKVGMCGCMCKAVVLMTWTSPNSKLHLLLDSMQQ